MNVNNANTSGKAEHQTRKLAHDVNDTTGTKRNERMMNTQTRIILSGITALTITILSLVYGMGINSLLIGIGFGIMVMVMTEEKKQRIKTHEDFIREEEYAREQGRIQAREDRSNENRNPYTHGYSGAVFGNGMKVRKQIRY